MIAALREQLAADLAPLDVAVHSAWVDKVTAPCAIVTPPASGSYVVGGPTFGAYTIAVDVVLLVPQASPSIALAALETLVEAVLLNTQDWALNGVDSPSAVNVAGAELLGTIVHLSKPTRL